MLPPAYIDPGSQSLLFQVLIGGLLAALYALKLHWQRFKSRLKGLRDRLAGQR